MVLREPLTEMSEDEAEELAELARLRNLLGEFTLEFPEQGDEIEEERPPFPEIPHMRGFPFSDMTHLEQMIAEKLGLPARVILPDDCEVIPRGTPTELVVNATTGEQSYRPLEDFDAFFAEHCRAQGESEESELADLRRTRAISVLREAQGHSGYAGEILDLLGIPRKD